MVSLIVTGCIVKSLAVINTILSCSLFQYLSNSAICNNPVDKESIEKYQFAKHLYENKGTPINEACKKAGISKTTFYRIDKVKL